LGLLVADESIESDSNHSIHIVGDTRGVVELLPFGLV
jgi:hypothetical protein